jgi:hypothetical protein
MQGLDRKKQERHGLLEQITFQGQTVYVETVFDIMTTEKFIMLDEDNKPVYSEPVEEEVWRDASPNVRFGFTKEQLQAEYASRRAKCEPEEELMYDGFISSLEAE